MRHHYNYCVPKGKGGAGGFACRIRVPTVAGVACLFVAAAQGQISAQRAVLDQYCVTCHNQKLKTAGLMLDRLDPAQVAGRPKTWRKSSASFAPGMMPPQGAPRPPCRRLRSAAAALETGLDRAAAAKPDLRLAEVAGPESHRIRERHPRICSLSISTPRLFLPADDPVTASTTWPAGSASRRPWSKGMATAAKMSRLALGRETGPSRKSLPTPARIIPRKTRSPGCRLARAGASLSPLFPADGEHRYFRVPGPKTPWDVYWRGEMRKTKNSNYPRRRAREALSDWDRHSVDSSMFNPIKRSLVFP